MLRIERIRTEILHLTQVEMAEITGVRQATVSRWESGELVPTTQNWAAIRDAVKELPKNPRTPKWSDAWVLETTVPNEAVA